MAARARLQAVSTDTALLAANMELRQQRDEARESEAATRRELGAWMQKLARVQNEADALYAMLCLANEYAVNQRRITTAQVEKADRLRQERFGS